MNKIQFLFLMITLSLYETNSNNLFNKLKAIDQENNNFNPINYLINYGYLNSDSGLKKTLSSLKINSNSSVNNTNNKNSVKSLKKAIINFQKYANLKKTGIIDKNTLELMKTPRCGHPDLKPSLLKKSKRYVLQGSKWSKSKLKWKVGKYPYISTMTNQMFDEELERAFNLWSSVSGLEFEHLKENLLIFNQQNSSELKSDIEIRFESGFHGDSEPFDGPGLILGHAFFPEFSSSTHFDADELWTSRRIDGVNFYQVAVHELGHALGLEHSDNYDAIMAPFFRGYTEDFHLHEDDITAIEILYGRNNRNQINFKQQTVTNSVKSSLLTLPQTTKILSVKHDRRLSYLCSDAKFDAISQLSDFYTYIFKGPYVYKFDFEHKIIKDYPKLISSVFRDWAHSGFITLPANLDAVLYVPENKTTYFFKNNLYWKSSALYELDEGFPRIISADFKGLNSRNGFNGKLDAAFVWSGNRRTYFISGNRYWRFDFSTGWIESGYPKDMGYWRGLNSKITNAFLYSDEKTYFFKENVFYRFNDESFKVDDQFYPRSNSEFWFLCS